MTVQGPVKEQQPDGISHRGVSQPGGTQNNSMTTQHNHVTSQQHNNTTAQLVELRGGLSQAGGTLASAQNPAPLGGGGGGLCLPDPSNSWHRIESFFTALFLQLEDEK